MWGFRKKRSKVKQFIDEVGYSQEDLRKASGVSRNTISKMCREPGYVPSGHVIKRVMKAIKRLDPSAKVEDFFDV